MSESLYSSLSSLFKKAKKALTDKKPSDGLSYLKSAESIISNTSTPIYLKCETFFHLASFFQSLGQRQMSIKYLSTILKLSQDPIIQAKAHLNIGFLLSLQGLHQKSIFHNTKALNLLQNTDEYEGIVSAYHSLGLEYTAVSQFPKSLNAYKQGLIISKTYLGVNHKLTKILRSLYLETSKNISLLGFRNNIVYKGEQIEISQIVTELETKPPKAINQIPKYLSGSSSPAPKHRNVLTRSVQCGTEDQSFIGKEKYKNSSVQTKFRRNKFSETFCKERPEKNIAR